MAGASRRCGACARGGDMAGWSCRPGGGSSWPPGGERSGRSSECLGPFLTSRRLDRPCPHRRGRRPGLVTGPCSSCVDLDRLRVDAHRQSRAGRSCARRGRLQQSGAGPSPQRRKHRSVGLAATPKNGRSRDAWPDPGGRAHRVPCRPPARRRSGRSVRSALCVCRVRGAAIEPCGRSQPGRTELCSRHRVLCGRSAGPAGRASHL